jgi:uncharacterized protein
MRQSRQFSFARGTQNKLEYYVYALIDPRNRRPFYIGKGLRNRGLAHGRKRDESNKQRLIDDIRKAGRRERCVVICHGLTEEEAFRSESLLIKTLSECGVRLTNAVGGKSGSKFWWPEGEVNARLGASMVKINKPCVLVSLNKGYKPELSESELHRITCGNWGFGAPSAKRSLISRVEFILGVYQGIVRTGYRVDHQTWKRVRKGRGRPRWKCSGKPPPKYVSRWVDHDVSRYLRGRQWSFRYINVPRR